MAKKSDYTVPLLGAGALAAYFLLRKKSTPGSSGGLRGRAERQASAGQGPDDGIHTGSNAM